MARGMQRAWRVTRRRGDARLEWPLSSVKVGFGILWSFGLTECVWTSIFGGNDTIIKGG